MRIQINTPRPEERAVLEAAVRRGMGERAGDWFVSLVESPSSPAWYVRIEGPDGFVWSRVLEDPEEQAPGFLASVIDGALSPRARLRLRDLEITGFGPFESTVLRFGSFETLVGANGSGKTSTFEFLRAIREYVRSEIPAEIVPGWETREVYHRPGPDRLGWRMTCVASGVEYSFMAEVIGPAGSATISVENIHVLAVAEQTLLAELTRRGDRGLIVDATETPVTQTEIKAQRSNQLALRSYVSPAQLSLYRLREHIDSWRFFSGIRFNDKQLRQPALIEDSPSIREDGGNLAGVLHWLQSEHRALFLELQTHLQSAVPNFRALSTKPSGPGRVTLQWSEHGLISPLSAADLSDGSLRLLLWLTLALVPNPPDLVCIDEPEVGLHPRALPLIAALFKKMSDRTQVLMTTHSSYLLTQVEMRDIAVFRKRDNNIDFLKPRDSAALLATLEDFGSEEIELMHRSDELEALS